MCKPCKERISLQPEALKRKRSSNGLHITRKKRSVDDDSDEDDYDIPTPGVMKVGCKTLCLRYLVRGIDSISLI